MCRRAGTAQSCAGKFKSIAPRRHLCRQASRELACRACRYAAPTRPGSDFNSRLSAWQALFAGDTVLRSFGVVVVKLHVKGDSSLAAMNAVRPSLRASARPLVAARAKPLHTAHHIARCAWPIGKLPLLAAVVVPTPDRRSNGTPAPASCFALCLELTGFTMLTGTVLVPPAWR